MELDVDDALARGQEVEGDGINTSWVSGRSCLPFFHISSISSSISISEPSSHNTEIDISNLFLLYASHPMIIHQSTSILMTWSATRRHDDQTPSHVTS
jgi:hypothetical protein